MLLDIVNYLNSYKLFKQTLNFSIGVQIVTGIIEFLTLFVIVTPKLFFLKQLLVVEFIVQMIELMFYAWLFIKLNNISNITPKRYADWVITTPTMLFTLIMYLIYVKEENKENLNLYKLTNENKENIGLILVLNLLMLIFGYLGETQMLNKLLTLTLGFVPFIWYFWLIYENYAKYSSFGKKLFYYFLIIWSFYGIVAYLPYYLRNSFYNILDLFSKNFFGLYLSYLIISNTYIK